MRTLTRRGLNRALLLGYAGDSMGGFDRDMARMRGVEPGSRPLLTALATAVLSREEAAVTRLRKELAARRDAAAAALAFELAARVQEELTALDWVLSEQKVTQVDGDADIQGWADGVLVSFELRGGRVHAWRQRACAAPPASVAATPVAWRRFADRNAALAARLSAA